MKAIIPPPVVLLFCGALMWLIGRFWPEFRFEVPYNAILFWVVLLVGLALLAAGVSNILRRKTPIHPDRQSLSKVTALVTTGVFRYTRNPIYLGMAVMLLAWFLFLENWLAAVALVGFVWFITKYQIRPEEEALEKIFGEEYVRYKEKVRRWLG